MFKKFLIKRLLKTVKENINLNYHIEVKDADKDLKPELVIYVEIFGEEILNRSIELPFKLQGYIFDE